MHEYSVTIGRNVGDEPMSTHDWRLFRESVNMHLTIIATIDDVQIDAIETTRGTGEWNGVREDNARVVMRTLSPLSETALGKLRVRLGNLATANMQDAIAFTIGTSELIDAR